MTFFFYTKFKMVSSSMGLWVGIQLYIGKYCYPKYKKLFGPCFQNLFSKCFEKLLTKIAFYSVFAPPINLFGICFLLQFFFLVFNPSSLKHKNNITCLIITTNPVSHKPITNPVSHKHAQPPLTTRSTNSNEFIKNKKIKKNARRLFYVSMKEMNLHALVANAMWWWIYKHSLQVRWSSMTALLGHWERERENSIVRRER